LLSGNIHPPYHHHDEHGKNNKGASAKFPGIRVIVGGAPLSKEFADKIGAGYSADPQGAVNFLNSGK